MVAHQMAPVLSCVSKPSVAAVLRESSSSQPQLSSFDSFLHLQVFSSALVLVFRVVWILQQLFNCNVTPVKSTIRKIQIKF
jgi:hypothetical protein